MVCNDEFGSYVSSYTALVDCILVTVTIWNQIPPGGNPWTLWTGSTVANQRATLNELGYLHTVKPILEDICALYGPPAKSIEVARDLCRRKGVVVLRLL